MYGTIYGQQTAKWQLGAENNGLGPKWTYDGPPTVGPSIYRQGNLRAYGFRPGQEVLTVAQPASLAVDPTSLVVGVLVGLLAAPYLGRMFKK